jgi:hypothetical protein
MNQETELEKAWRDYYGPPAVKSYADVRIPGATYASHGRQWPALSSFMICASEGDSPKWAIESHAWKCQQPSPESFGRAERVT